MTLYFLRHGEADWPHWDKPDDERPLTKKGKKEMRRVASFLCRHHVCPSLILSSPLPRARETAEIVAKCLKIKTQEERALAKGFNAAKLRTMLKDHDVEELMIVGHEPDFSAVIRALCGARIKLAKAGLAHVDLARRDDEKGRLIWLVPPKFSRK